MNDDKSSDKKSDPVNVLQIFLAEYNALRREIELLIEHQKDIMNFSILTIAAMAGLFGIFKADTELQSFSYIYLVFFPLIFLLLALLYADKTVRILRAADYIHNHLRKEIVKKYKEERIWQWELYKSGDSFERELALWLDRKRWYIFLFPCVISIVIFLILSYDDTTFFNNEMIMHHLKYFILLVYSIALFFLFKKTSQVISQLQETSPFKDQKDRVEKDNAEIVAKNIARAVAEHFDKIPQNVRSTLLLKLSKNDIAIWDVASIVTEHFNDFPQDARDLLFELAESDKTAGAVSDVVAKHFDKLPDNVRNELLRKLVKVDP